LQQPSTGPSGPRPLFVDLDGTLLRTDLLVEGVFALLKKNILFLFMLPVWMLRGKACLKEQIAHRVDIDPESLPYHADLVELLRKRKEAGGRLILTTASPRKFAAAVADYLGLFDEVQATADGINLRGRCKLAIMREVTQETGFDYAGNALADLPIWREAADCIVVNPSPAVLRRIRADRPDSVVLADPGRNSLGQFALGLRLHQWLKNVLVFVPLAMAHRLDDPGLVANSMLAFLAFGLCASSVYLLNDLFDLPADRRHPTKQYRPLASGWLSVGIAALLVPTLFAGSIALALLLPFEFVLVLSGYFAITLAYSLYLKHAVMLDVLVLAGLYTMRLIGGAAATSVTLSFWLLSFAMFLFLSLALAKRFSELDLHSCAHEGVAVRGYRDSDLPMLAQLGSSSAVVSVLVLALYINSDSVSVLYDRPQVIWLLCPLLLYLISRIWLLAHRKMLDEDPVLFIIRDRRSQLLAALGIILLWVAS